jgi:hypothetical protein
MFDDMSTEEGLAVIYDMMSLFQQRYLVIHTQYTIHHIERTTYTNRGRWRWFAESKPEAFEQMEKEGEGEAYRSHIDDCDLFPRLYFLDNSFIEEFRSWLNCRNLKITNIEASPL